ncbi:hypothetical protein ADIS_1346 [Lunatimonas lonarensis]|uniref:Uncharacterized protein n=1 Tax=Lunatimonas lonarensis TaxID=1232681 RepID=R7ZVY4_9BACT|nr:hypothetical protein ADIS_1346 [Lunatimonas lonarensis]
MKKILWSIGLRTWREWLALALNKVLKTNQKKPIHRKGKQFNIGYLP